MSFPLYNTLLTELEKTPQIKIDNDIILNFIDFVKALNKNTTELIYALIKKYEIEHENSGNLFPYGGKELKSGYKFDFAKLPHELQQLLILFYNKNKVVKEKF